MQLKSFRNVGVHDQSVFVLIVATECVLIVNTSVRSPLQGGQICVHVCALACVFQKLVCTLALSAFAWRLCLCLNVSYISVSILCGKCVLLVEVLVKYPLTASMYYIIISVNCWIVYSKL